MVNYRDPAVVAQDGCAYAFAAKRANSESQLTSSTVALSKIWHAVAGLYLCVSHNVSNINNNFISSWEFVTTLDYEWSVIRGRCVYGWTRWVCSDDARFLLGFVTQP